MKIEKKLSVVVVILVCYHIIEKLISVSKLYLKNWSIQIEHIDSFFPTFTLNLISLIIWVCMWRIITVTNQNNNLGLYFSIIIGILIINLFPEYLINSIEEFIPLIAITLIYFLVVIILGINLFNFKESHLGIEQTYGGILIVYSFIQVVKEMIFHFKFENNLFFQRFVEILFLIIMIKLIYEIIILLKYRQYLNSKVFVDK